MNALELQAEVKDFGPHKYGCVYAPLPEALAKEITDWVIENIPEFHLGQGGRELTPHITVKYGFKESDPETVANIKHLLNEFPPFVVKLNGISLFKDNKDGDVLKLDVISPVLHELNKELSDKFLTKDSYPEYVPHATLAYLDPLISDTYLKEQPPFASKSCKIDRLYWADPDGDREEIRLSFIPDYAGLAPLRELVSEAKSIAFEQTGPETPHQPTIAVDFDGTIATIPIEGTHPHPLDILSPREGAVEALEKLKDAGWRIIVFTVRDDVDGIAAWLDEYDIPFDYINTNPDQETDSGKVLADLYVDDRAISAKQSWDNILAEVIQHRTEILPSAQHLIITGFSGAGKSTLAQQLSFRLGLPTHKVDSDPLWKENSDVADAPDRYTKGTDAYKKYRRLLKKLVARAVAKPRPHILEGCQFLCAKGMLRGHRILVIDADENTVVQQRLKRDQESGKLEEQGEEARIKKAKDLYQKLKADVDRVKQFPGVEVISPAEMTQWIDNYVHQHIGRNMDLSLNKKAMSAYAETSGGALVGMPTKKKVKKSLVFDPKGKKKIREIRSRYRKARFSNKVTRAQEYFDAIGHNGAPQQPKLDHGGKIKSILDAMRIKSVTFEQIGADNPFLGPGGKRWFQFTQEGQLIPAKNPNAPQVGESPFAKPNVAPKKQRSGIDVPGRELANQPKAGAEGLEFFQDKLQHLMTKDSDKVRKFKGHANFAAYLFNKIKGQVGAEQALELLDELNHQMRTMGSKYRLVPFFGEDDKVGIIEKEKLPQDLDWNVDVSDDNPNKYVLKAVNGDKLKLGGEETHDVDVQIRHAAWDQWHTIMYPKLKASIPLTGAELELLPSAIKQLSTEQVKAIMEELTGISRREMEGKFQKKKYTNHLVNWAKSLSNPAALAGAIPKLKKPEAAPQAPPAPATPPEEEILDAEEVPENELPAEPAKAPEPPKPKEAPKPKQEAKPAAKNWTEYHDKLLNHFSSGLDANNKLSPAQKQNIKASMKKTIQNMTPNALRYASSGARGGTVWYSSAADLKAAYLAHGGKPLKEGSRLLGFYTTGSQALHSAVDIPLQQQMTNKLNKKFESSVAFSHELGHALDNGFQSEKFPTGTKFQFSSTPEWTQAWKSEIERPAGKATLSHHATKSSREGFAEFARLVFGPQSYDRAEAQRRFPKSFEFFYRHGLLNKEQLEGGKSLGISQDQPMLSEEFNYGGILRDGTAYDGWIDQ